MAVAVEAPERTQPFVLVADDNADILELVSYRLERSGYNVVRAHDGEEALSVLTEQHPDLAVLDVMMPKLTGYEVTRKIREDEAAGDIPVILLSGCVMDADVTRGFEAGADDYVRKPFSPDELRARVHAILGRR